MEGAFGFTDWKPDPRGVAFINEGLGPEDLCVFVAKEHTHPAPTSAPRELRASNLPGQPANKDYDAVPEEECEAEAERKVYSYRETFARQIVNG